jgi:hypothetical protein
MDTGDLNIDAGENLFNAYAVNFFNTRLKTRLKAMADRAIKSIERTADGINNEDRKSTVYIPPSLLD